MDTIGFKARSLIDTLAVSDDARLLAAADSEDHVYVYDLENDRLLLEEKVELDIENGFHFDRSGKRLFIDDGVVLRALSLPDLSEVPLEVLNEINDPAMPMLLDTTPAGEALLRDNNGYVYILNASCTRCDTVARFENVGIPGKHLSTIRAGRFTDFAAGRVLLSADTMPPLHTMMDLVAGTEEQVLPPWSEWEPGMLVGMNASQSYVIRNGSQLTRYAADGTPASSVNIPEEVFGDGDRFGYGYQLSPGLDLLAVPTLKPHATAVFDMQTGAECHTLEFAPAAFVFLETAGGLSLIGGFSDGSVSVMPIPV